MFSKMEEAIKPKIINQFFTLPFNRELANGTLPYRKFLFFLKQDSMYLSAYSQALKQTGLRMPHKEQNYFCRLADGVTEIQNEIDQKYFKKPETPSLFQPVRQPDVMIPVIQHYTSHLLLNSYNAPVEVALASLLPCFYLYTRLGLQMNHSLIETNPYYSWIMSYSGENFLLSTEKIIQLINSMGKGLSIEEKNRMTEAFKNSAEYEVSFLDVVYGKAIENKDEQVPAFSP